MNTKRILISLAAFFIFFTKSYSMNGEIPQSSEANIVATSDIRRSLQECLRKDKDGNPIPLGTFSIGESALAQKRFEKKPFEKALDNHLNPKIPKPIRIQKEEEEEEEEKENNEELKFEIRNNTGKFIIIYINYNLEENIEILIIKKNHTEYLNLPNNVTFRTINLNFPEYNNKWIHLPILSAKERQLILFKSEKGILSSIRNTSL